MHSSEITNKVKEMIYRRNLLVVCTWRHQNMILQIMINLPQISIWPVRSHNASLYQIWSYLDQWEQSYGPKKLDNFLDNFLSCYMGRWAGGHSFAHHQGCRNINVWRFSKLWTAVSLAFVDISTWNLQKSFKSALLTVCKNFVWKVVNLNF